MKLTKQTNVTWSSLEDMTSDAKFVSERRNKIQSMQAENLTDGIVSTDNLTGQLKFVDENSCEIWIAFIKELASKYKKTIVSTTITTI